MEWMRTVTKKNGKPRKQFVQWQIPKGIRHDLQLQDGDRCSLALRIDTYKSTMKDYTLVSGGEIHLAKSDAENLKRQAAKLPHGIITFLVGVDELAAARSRALAEDAFASISSEDARRRVLSSIVQRQGQPKFRKSLLEAYESKCAISGCDCPDALEAAHIKPYKGAHTNVVSNGILLRSDLHTLFDLGKPTIDTQGIVRVVEELLATTYGQLDGQRLRLPKKRSWQPRIG